MALDDEILVETKGRVRLITINREERRNARTAAHNRRIADAVIDADQDSAVDLIAITGVGSKAFSAGADLREAADLADSGRDNYGPLHALEHSVHEVIVRAAKPCMAIVNGPALAGGFELALACGVRVAADHAFFAMPEAKRGRGAHFGSVMLPRVVPPAVAMEWLLTGRRIPVAEAARWGLVNRIVTYKELMPAAMDFAAEIIAVQETGRIA